MNNAPITDEEKNERSLALVFICMSIAEVAFPKKDVHNTEETKAKIA